MSNERLCDKDTKPSEEEILKCIGEGVELWRDLREYLSIHYDHESQLDFAGKKYGWSIRYRKSGKTLVTLFPEYDGFTALIVLGKKEVAKADLLIGDLSPRVKKLFQGADQLHDGRWLWIRPSSKADLESIKILIRAKRRPKSLSS
ncbi:MAG: DUF3788 domain-containing protein [Thermodesulfobacteriota bacterium]|nr:DUF3788 domain-containing protein [Thermodesulfobacteriota bacterium]